ncbi:hypothetical protein LXL04_020757 [Taraxacum kok-saghyz]
MRMVANFDYVFEFENRGTFGEEALEFARSTEITGSASSIATKRTDIQVRVPNGVGNKGSKKRLISEKEKAIIRAKNGSRKCGGCGLYVDHNARKCPNTDS